MTDNSPEAQRDLTQWTALETLPDREILSGRVGKDLVFVWRAGDIIRVYGATCPHLGAPLNEGLIEGTSLRCPWHHACFDLLTGAATAAPAFDPLMHYPVDLQSGSFAVRPATTPSPPASPAVLARAEKDVMAIIGGGAAGFAAADTLRREGWRGGIAMFSDEAAAPYDRTLLTKDYLDGNFGEDRLPIARHSLDALGVHFEGEAHVAGIDVENKRLKLANGGSRSYSKLLLATGAAPRKLDLPGAELPHVIALRSLADCRRILGALKDIRHVAVIGGSFIALETAASLRSRGLSVSVIAPEPHPMEKIFGRALSDLILDVHRDNGVTLRLSSKATRIQDHSVVLENGQEISADLVILGVGVEPRLEIAHAAGLTLDRGLVVNSRLETSAEGIFGAGDIARWPDSLSGQSIRVEHWVVAERQGQAAALNMLGADRPFQMVPFFWTKHFDLSIRYVGHAEQWDDLIVEGDLSRRNAIVRIRGKGRDLAVATVGRDDESLRAELAMERQLRESEQK